MTFSSFQHGSIAAFLKNDKNKLAIVVKGPRSIYVVMSGLVILLSAHSASENLHEAEVSSWEWEHSNEALDYEQRVWGNFDFVL